MLGWEERREEKGVKGVPVWNRRNTRKRLVKARGATCTQGYWDRYVESGRSGESVVSNALA